MAVNMYPPSYSPASSNSSLEDDALPSYTACPHASEAIIQSTPSARRSLPTGSFVKRGKHAVILLHNQEPDASIAQYSNRESIAGEIDVEHSDSVVCVKVKLQASISTVTSAGSATQQILSTELSLYKQTRCSCPSGPPPCPGIIAFSIDLPSTFRHDEFEQDFPLPPSLRLSHNHSEDDAGLFHADVEYSLLFSITRRVSVLGLKFTTSDHGVRVPIKYAPRSRPASPAIDAPLRGSLKCCPDEWTQMSSELQPKDPSLWNILFDFFVPSVRVFSVGEPIHFHLLACGSLAAIRELWQSTHTSTATCAPRSMPTSINPLGTGGPSLRVSLLRQYVADTHRDGSRGVHSVDLGEAELYALPPAIDSFCKRSGSACLAWEGLIKFTCTKTVGTFNAGNLRTKDFLVVSFHPPCPKSNLPFHKFYVPIRLVSDAWVPPAGYYDNYEQ